MKDLTLAVLRGNVRIRHYSTRSIIGKSLRFVSGETGGTASGECDATCGGEAPLNEA